MTDPTPEQIAEAKRILEAHELAQQRKQWEADRLRRIKEEAPSVTVREKVSALWPLNWHLGRLPQGEIYADIVPRISVRISPHNGRWYAVITPYDAEMFSIVRGDLSETVTVLQNRLRDIGERMVQLANVKAK